MHYAFRDLHLLWLMQMCMNLTEAIEHQCADIQVSQGAVYGLCHHFSPFLCFLGMFQLIRSIKVIMKNTCQLKKRTRVIGALLGRCGLLVRMACFLKKCTKLGVRRAAQKACEEPERAWVTQWRQDWQCLCCWEWSCMINNAAYIV